MSRLVALAVAALALAWSPAGAEPLIARAIARHFHADIWLELDRDVFSNMRHLRAARVEIPADHSLEHAFDAQLRSRRAR